MIPRSLLRPSASVFKNGACILCRSSLLVRGKTYERRNPPKPVSRARTPEEIVARQLGRQHVSEDEKDSSRMPTAILLSAWKSGRIRIKANLVEQIIRGFEPVMRTSSAVHTLVEVCSALAVRLDDLTDVGQLYLRTKNPADQALGRNLLLSASSAGSLSATVFLLYSARRQRQLGARELVKPKSHLKNSVQSGTTNVQALVLQGLLYQDQKSHREAVSCFTKAIALPPQDKPADNSRFVKILQWVGFDIDTKDPNLDLRGPQDLELDQAVAYMQLASLKADEKGNDYLKITALEYDEPRAYFQLATATAKYSYDWLQYMRKAAASGHVSAMENIALLLACSEEYLEEEVRDQRVRDWVLKSPIYDSGPQSLRSYIRGSNDSGKRRSVMRYRWAITWHNAARARAHGDEKLEEHSFALLHWTIANLLEEMGEPMHRIRFWRVCSLALARAEKIAQRVDPKLKKESERIFREMNEDSKSQESREIFDFWTRNCRGYDNDWLHEFLMTIDDVPIGTWRYESKTEKKPPSNE